MRWLGPHRLRRMAWISLPVLALVAVLWSVPALLDQSRWIGWCEQKASASTGRAVTIGKISVHLLPAPGFDAQQITIANPSWASQPYLARIDHLSAQFTLASIVRRTFQLARLQADGVQLDIETDAVQGGNWQMAAQDNPAHSSHFSALRSLDAHNVTLRYAKEKRDRFYWQLPNLHIDAPSPGRDIHAQAELIDAQHSVAQGSIPQRSIPQRSIILSAFVDALATPTHAHISVASGAAQVVIDARQLQSARVPANTFAVQVNATRLDQLLAFFQVESRSIAPLQINTDMRADGRQIYFTQLAAQLGGTRVGGSAQVDLDRSEPILQATLSVPRLDWVRLLGEAGRPPLAPKPPGELFRTHRLPWRMLAAVHGMRAQIGLQIASLKTRSGIELSNASTQLDIHDGQLQASAMRAQMLGGTATGTLHLTGADQTAQLQLQLQDVSLHDGLRAVGKATPLSGGAIQLTASVHARGESIKALAASLSGPVTITLGPTRIISAAGARSEEMLTGLLPYFAAHDAGEIQLECGSAVLPFQAGRASARPLVGVRSQASELLTQGDLDLRQQSLDLRGRVRSRSGLSLGLSALSGDIRVSGPLVHPRAKLDPAGTPGAIARIGAAVATAGLSLIGTAIWDHVHPGVNPCEAVLARRSSPTAAKAVR